MTEGFKEFKNFWLSVEGQVLRTMIEQKHPEDVLKVERDIVQSLNDSTNSQQIVDLVLDTQLAGEDDLLEIMCKVLDGTIEY